MTTVNAHLFAIVASFASTEQTRPHIGGVLIEPHRTEGVILVATDGHRMLVAHDVDGFVDEPLNIQLSKQLLKACSGTKADRNKNGVNKLVIEGQLASVVDPYGNTQGSQRDAVTDYQFPDWRRVSGVNTVGECAYTGFYNTKYITTFSAVPKLLSGRDTAMTIRAVDVLTPAVVRWDGIANVFGILMPMRGDEAALLPSPIPDFMGAAVEVFEEGLAA